MRSLPVYAIKDFRNFSEENAFYASGLKSHIKHHDFTNTPHKHDFYFLVLFISGSGTHEIDFHSYPVKPGSIFLLRPGQMHNWKLSPESDGYIFFHTRDFHDEGFTSLRVQDYPFYSSHHNTPLVVAKNKSYTKLKELVKEITEEYHQEDPMKFQKLHALVQLVYIELSRMYAPTGTSETVSYLDKLRTFEELIDIHFRKLKTASDYAALMNISEKHLNRISKSCVQKTSTELISQRIVLEAKRMLIQSKLNVTQIAYALGYKDKSYFTRFFKKHALETPLGFLSRYKH